MASQSDVLKSLNWSPEKQDTFFNKLKPEDQKQILKQQGWSDDKVNAFYTKLEPYKAAAPAHAPETIIEKIEAAFHPAKTPEEQKALMSNSENYPKMGVKIGTIAPLIGAMAPGPLSIPGYVAGKKLANVAESVAGGKPTTFGKEVKSLPKDAMEGLFQYTIGKGLDWAGGKIAPYLENIAEKTYASAAKMPLTRKWLQARGGKFAGLSDREIAAKLAIKERIPLSAKGLEKATAGEEEARSMIDGLFNRQSPVGGLVSRDSLKKGLDDAYVQAASSSDPAGAKRMLDATWKKFSQRPENLTLRQLQDIKQQMYKEITDYTGKFKSFHDTALHGISHESMSTLERIHPELSRLNATDAAYIKLKEAIQKAVGRESNKYAIGLTEAVGAAGGAAYGGVEGKSWGAAGEGAAAGMLFTKVMRDPYVLSQLAFALSRAAKMPANNIFEKAISIEAAKGISEMVPGLPEGKAPEPTKESAPAPANPEEVPAEKTKTDLISRERQKGETLRQWANRLYKSTGAPTDAEGTIIVGDHGRY